MSKDKLNPQQISLLTTKFLECSCCRTVDNRKILFFLLLNKYQGITISFDNLNLATIFHALIIACQDHYGALSFFIDTMDELYEKNSISIQELKTTYKQIFSTPPANARVRSEPTRLVIICNNNCQRFIPNQFPDIQESEIKNIIIYTQKLHICKKIHTLCEKLARDYIDLYQYIMSGEFDKAKETIQQFHKKCNEFTVNLTILKKDNHSYQVFLFQPFDILDIIPHCITCLEHIIDFPPQNTYGLLGKDLAKRINDLLFEALRLADRILQNYFNLNLTEGDSNP
jgi:hypothetical protein